VNDIISIFVYGSYLYGDVDYKPDDIDAGIIIKGSYFKYIIDQIEVVPPLSNELIVPVQKINVFIYGEDNMAKGVPIEDTVVAGVTHTQATLHELIVAYWRDIVLEGKDFAPIEKNERNIIVTLGREIEYCYARLFKKGNTKEVPNIIFKKISCRMIEVNLFLHFLFPQLQLNWEYLFRLPSRALQSKVSYKEIKTLCDKTLLTYSKLRRKYL
jgi:hypothetical protein